MPTNGTSNLHHHQSTSIFTGLLILGQACCSLIPWPLSLSHLSCSAKNSDWTNDAEGALMYWEYQNKNYKAAQMSEPSQNSGDETTPVKIFTTGKKKSRSVILHYSLALTASMEMLNLYRSLCPHTASGSWTTARFYGVLSTIKILISTQDPFLIMYLRCPFFCLLANPLHEVRMR